MDQLLSGQVATDFPNITQVVVEGLAKAADMACHTQLRASHDSQVPHSRIAHWDVTPSFVNCWDIDMLYG